MKGKRFLAMLAVLVVLALAGLFTRTPAPPKLPDLSQRIVKGRPVSLWLQDVTERIDQSAAQVLREVSDEVVPHLIAAAKTKDSTGGSPAIMGRALGSEQVRESAAKVLKQIDPEAAAQAGIK